MNFEIAGSFKKSSISWVHCYSLMPFFSKILDWNNWVRKTSAVGTRQRTSMWALARHDTSGMCGRIILFLMLLFKLICSMSWSALVMLLQTHINRTAEPDRPPLCRITWQDRPVTTTMLIEVLIRRPGLNWQSLMGWTGCRGMGWQGDWDPECLVLDTSNTHCHHPSFVWRLCCAQHFN